MNQPGADCESQAVTDFQARTDADQMNLLALFHYILGGFTAVFANIFIVHIVMGLMIAHNPGAFIPHYSAMPTPAQQPFPYITFFPPEMGYLIAGMGAAVVLCGWTLGAMNIYAGRCIKARKRYTFILVVAAFDCALLMPLGTALGVCTFVVLLRPQVKELFPL